MNGFRMRDLRQKANLLQLEVAAELQLHNVTICNWEKTGKELPKVYEEAFMRLINDSERVYFIRQGRRARRKAK
jgi:DNA-binding transcriptional regulator YiaG